jgi:hypothetical protein
VTEHIYLNIDAQRYECRVVSGAEKALQYIDIIQLEMPLIPLCVNEMAFLDLYGLLNGKGNTMVGVEPGFADMRSGQLLQLDGN